MQNDLMQNADFSSLYNLLTAHGYWIMFLVMCVEGPMATAAAAFASSLGYFNLIAVFFISLAGDMVPDTIYYYMGYGARASVIEKYGHRFGLTQARMQRMEELLKKHTIKTIIAMKLTPIAPIPGFMMIGSVRIGFFKFFNVCLLVTVAKTTLFLLLGYYSGMFYNFAKYMQYGNIVLIIIIAAFILLFVAYRKFFQWLSSKIEKV